MHECTRGKRNKEANAFSRSDRLSSLAAAEVVPEALGVGPLEPGLALLAGDEAAGLATARCPAISPKKGKIRSSKRSEKKASNIQ